MLRGKMLGDSTIIENERCIVEAQMRVASERGVVLDSSVKQYKYESFYEYDEEGRVVKAWDSDGKEDIYTYDLEGMVTCKDEEQRIYKLDKAKNLVYCKDENYEIWSEYNEFGQSTHYKEICKGEVYEEWGEYNEAGLLTSLKNSKGYEEHRFYNEAGLLTHLKNTDGYEEFRSYDSENRLLRRDDKVESLEINEYWENGKIKSKYEKSGGEIRTVYNSRGLPVHKWSAQGEEEFWEYDLAEREIYHGKFSRKEYWNEYDDKGNLINVKVTGVYGNHGYYEKWHDYDSLGNKIHTRDSEGSEEWHEYNGKKQEIFYKNNQNRAYCCEYNSEGNLVNYELDIPAKSIKEEYIYDKENHLIHSKQTYNKKRENHYAI